MATLRDDILRLLEARDRLRRPATNSQLDWIDQALELLLRAELARTTTTEKSK